MKELRTFSPEQLVAALLTKLKENASLALEGEEVKNCVIAFPSYFDEKRRRKLMQAAEIADLNCVEWMSEASAVALDYGFYRDDLPAPDEEPRHVVFVDLGQSSLQVG